MKNADRKKLKKIRERTKKEKTWKFLSQKIQVQVLMVIS